MSTTNFEQIDSALAMTCRVQARIHASAGIVWGLLTDARGFPHWNSTVTAIDGEIRDGERLRLHVPGTTRTFAPKVSVLVPGRQMTWSNGAAGVFRGVRTFLLQPANADATDFSMEERFSEAMFALTKRMLPDFRPIFETFAGDLQREAERIAQRSAQGASQT